MTLAAVEVVKNIKNVVENSYFAYSKLVIVKLNYLLLIAFTQPILTNTQNQNNHQCNSNTLPIYT